MTFPADPQSEMYDDYIPATILLVGPTLWLLQLLNPKSYVSQQKNGFQIPWPMFLLGSDAIKLNGQDYVDVQP